MKPLLQKYSAPVTDTLEQMMCRLTMPRGMDVDGFMMELQDFAQAFSRLSREVLVDALKSFFSEHKYRSWPTLGEFMKHVRDVSEFRPKQEKYTPPPTKNFDANHKLALKCGLIMLERAQKANKRICLDKLNMYREEMGRHTDKWHDMVKQASQIDLSEYTNGALSKYGKHP